MFHNWLSSAWGDLRRSPVQSFIAIGGLAIGLAAAIMAGIVTVNAFAYDRFIPGSDRLYMPVLESHDSRSDEYQINTPYNLAAYLREFPEVQAVARTAGHAYTLRHGDVQAKQNVLWADPNFFALYRVPVLHGDLQTALARPDGIVISRSVAEKFFGRDDVVGQTLDIRWVGASVDHTHVMTIRAVIADFPNKASTYTVTVFGSGLASFSVLTSDIGTQGMSKNGSMSTDGNTLVQLVPGASLETLNKRASALIAQFVPKDAPTQRAIHFERLDQINMSIWLHPDHRALLYAMLAITLAILLLSGANFINLSVARSIQRGLEVAIRKASGASRRALILQFLGESVLQTLFALSVAIALVEWSLPAVNAFLTAGAVFDYWRDLLLDGVMLAGTLIVGTFAGIYPALILSSFRPAQVLKGWMRGTAGSARLRQWLVGLQFAALIVLMIAAGAAFAQSQYATREAMRVNTDQMLMVRMATPCSDALKDRIAALPGVRGAACSSQRVLPDSMSTDSTPGAKGGAQVNMLMVPVDFGFLELYGVTPIAGRGFRRENGDAIPDHPAANQPVHYIINETAAHQLGYATPQAAMGQTLFGDRHIAAGNTTDIMTLPGTIVGVVKDFSFSPEMFASMSGIKQIPPTAYSIGPPELNFGAGPGILHVKLSGQDMPETLAAIDAVWKQSGAQDPIDRQFLNDYIQSQEQIIVRQGQAFAAFAGIAMLLACLGLFGVALSTASRRTKEIGIRKAMGARDGDVLKLLLWQFARPVLWANLIAWPLAWWAVDRWLASFAFHVDLNLWLFPSAGLMALLIALAAVAGQAFLVARQKPVLALRYE